MNRQSTEEIQGAEMLLYDTKIVDICHHTFVKIHRMHINSESWCKLWTMGDDLSM